MNVLHVNYTDLAGKRFNGYDLMEELRPQGISGKQVVLYKRSDNPDVISLLDTPENRALHHACTVVEQRNSMDNLLFPWGQVLMELDEFKNADLVHLHLLHNHVVSLLDLPRLTRLKPCVWTIHDPWAMTGHCIYPEQCEKWLTGCVTCPSLEVPFSMHEDCADRMWKVKQRTLAQIDVDIIVASEFMRDMVRRSPITSHFEHVHLVPFGIDTAPFLADDQQAASRKALGVPQDDFVVLFRATNYEFKGLSYIIEALGSAPPSRPTTLLTVDQTGLVKSLSADYNVVDLGWVDDEALVGRMFSACDVMLMPSTAEAFGLMAIEAMAAGRPVVCFEGTSLPGVSHAPECGIAVPLGDSAALRSALDSLSANPAEAKRRGQLGRTIVAEHYTHERYLDDMASVYREVLDRPR